MQHLQQGLQYAPWVFGHAAVRPCCAEQALPLLLIQVKKENPTATFGEVGKIMGLKWKEISPGEKAKFEEQAKKDKVPCSAPCRLPPVLPGSAHACVALRRTLRLSPVLLCFAHACAVLLCTLRLPPVAPLLCSCIGRGGSACSAHARTVHAC